LVPVVPVGVLLPDGGQFRLEARPPVDVVPPVDDPERVPRRVVGVQPVVLVPLGGVVAIEPSGLVVPVCPILEVVEVAGGAAGGGVPTVVPAPVWVSVWVSVCGTGVCVPVVVWVPAVVLPPVCGAGAGAGVPVVWAGAADARARIAAAAMDLTIILVSIDGGRLEGLSACAPRSLTNRRVRRVFRSAGPSSR
jgi:hypothetical protein